LVVIANVVFVVLTSADGLPPGTDTVCESTAPPVQVGLA
jgi:hypothetical protein